MKTRHGNEDTSLCRGKGTKTRLCPHECRGKGTKTRLCSHECRGKGTKTRLHIPLMEVATLAPASRGRRSTTHAWRSSRFRLLHLHARTIHPHAGPKATARRGQANESSDQYAQARRRNQDRYPHSVYVTLPKPCYYSLSRTTNFITLVRPKTQENRSPNKFPRAEIPWRTRADACYEISSNTGLLLVVADVHAERAPLKTKSRVSASETRLAAAGWGGAVYRVTHSTMVF